MKPTDANQPADHANGVTTAHPITPQAAVVSFHQRASHGQATPEQNNRPAMPAAHAPPTPTDPSRPIERRGWLREVGALDVAVYAAIAATPTPTLDRAFAAVSRAADHAKLWTATAAVLAAAGGRQGRRAAVDGLASIALTSTVVNAAIKPLQRRRRPDRLAHAVPIARHVEMPLSTSFPSGHAASAFAFATGVTHDLPTVGIPLHAAAAVIAYSRVHTGVHYPIDVIAGSVFGGSLSPVATSALDRWRARRATGRVR
jgi:membrane-associated phospholipid phosphatase